MSATSRISRTITLGGKTFSESKTLTGDGAIVLEKSVAAAKTGSLTTRGGDDTGTITGQASHGITTSAVVDIFWTASGVPGARYGVVVGTVNALAIPLTASGAGDVLPPQDTALTLQVQNTEAMLFAGNNIELIVIEIGGKGVVQFFDAGGLELAKQFHESGVYEWHDGLDDANPLLADDVITVKFTNGESSAAKTLKVGVLYN